MGLPPCCCDKSFDSWLAPAGVPTRSDKPASIVGMVAPAAFWAALRSMPRKDAICAMTSGLRSWVTTELRLIAMAISPLRCCLVGPLSVNLMRQILDRSKRRSATQVETALIVRLFDLDQRVPLRVKLGRTQ